MKNIDIAIGMASVMELRDMISMRKISMTKYRKACYSKHSVGKTIRRRDKDKEREANRHKHIWGLLNDAIEIKKAGLRLLEDEEDLSESIILTEKIFSEYLSRPFKI